MLPEKTTQGLAQAGTLVGEDFLPGFVLYGIPVGNGRYVKHHLSLKVKDVAGEVEQILNVLSGQWPDPAP